MSSSGWLTELTVSPERALFGEQNASMQRIVFLVRSAVAPVTHTRLFRRVAPTALPPLERLVNRLSGGPGQLCGRPVNAALIPDAEREEVADDGAAMAGLSFYDRESGRTVRLFRLQPSRVRPE
ncbi:MAG: Deazaflavin-dependent oxidoreductase, nitroreductase family [Microbacteriaceae bacterium]|nr:Deazaflavin-dependent oxidoreductase, nitroreductase family [Microbacteriaceae bacterium]